ncbi:MULTISPECIES: NHLP bacteriocin export ABC transporter permease/ATPase subunit [Nostocales]|uniref:Cation tolerance protein CutA n=3 Tax=Nostocales TaxID=1161 RepID=A0A0C1RMG3_9CYAN|nr:NHLP bacteriocin export ABC transporter permease/ATPase subunit [Tolypothrix bouteillei]KAF3887868.1 NHLP bacteriocin export ABC transporter permease/ATPase subunit [Tolypothrix bouteillei VB521301]
MEVLYRLQGNESLLLNDPEKVWIIKSGAMSLFVTEVRDEDDLSERARQAALRVEVGQDFAKHHRYLFNTRSGEALFGAAIDNPKSFLAVAIEPTELFQITITDLAAQIALGKASTIALVENWVNHLDRIFTNANRTTNKERYKLLTEQELATKLPNILADLHTDFFHSLNLLIKETEAASRSFMEREQLNHQVVSSALSKLAAVVQPQQETAFFHQPGTPLLVAAGAVARAMGITISPPTQSEDLSRVQEPIEALARSSQIRTRCVVLEDNWWLHEHGPLLAYTQEENLPVALLPAGNRYILFDPTTQTRTVVNQRVAATLATQAHQFYRPLPNVVNNAIQLFQFGVKGYQKDIILVLATGVVASALGMVVPQATALLLDNAIPDSDRGLLGQIGLALFALLMGRTVFAMSQGIISLRIENAADSALQPAIWDRLLRLSPAFFRNYSSGDLVNRVLSVNQIRQKLSGGTQRTLLSALFALLNLVLMFVYSWQLALVGVGIALLTTVVTTVASLVLIRKLRRQQQLIGEINGLTVQLINGVAKLRVAMAEDRAFAAWAEQYSQQMMLKASFQRIVDRVSVFNEVLPLVTSALLYWFAISSIQMAQTTGDGLTAGKFLAFNAALGIFIGGVTSLSNTLTDILAIVPLWERAKPILQAQPEYDPTKANPGDLMGRVALDNVTFRYRDDGLPILDRVSLHAEPGEFVAIVGPSGSGKSTILRLLLGFETPQSGTVFYDRFDLAELNLEAVRRQLGVVLQNGRIGTGSIFQNIAAGGLISQAQAQEAAQMAGLADDIAQMPMGLHTIVSEGGTNLSGGQRQRLLIARALVNQPKIILMDEATSSLDNRTQAIVSQSLEKLNATRIVIAHRLSTIRNADRIYAIEAGRVVQVGTFEKLVNTEGLFAQLVARQMESN